MSDNSGIDKLPKPPSFRGVFTQAKCVKCKSTDAATTSVSILLNSSMRSLKANISVGQTNVLQTNKNHYYTRKVQRQSYTLTSPTGKRRTLNTSHENLLASALATSH